ncbi:MAG: hypothetical protein JO340_05210 [Acidobacteriaceae bacterium]|nr:hypothetical protein [Acidobacteriaceae bacterium]
MPDSKVSRRTLFERGIGMAGAAGLVSLGAPPAAKASQYSYTPELSVFGASAENITASLDAAYNFLNTMMDAYATGSTIRLTQSYSDQQGLESTAFTYDNAVLIDAYLVRDESGDVSRAEVLGNGLLYAQQTNSYNDGRLFQAYFVNAPDPRGAYIQPAGAPFYFYGSSTGDMAWAGMALCHLYKQTKNSSYLNGATRLGNWIYTNAFSTTGAGGYTAGVDAGNNRLTYKSTEHNIDTFAFFTMLAAQTGSSFWTTRAQWAANLVAAMWNSTGGFFWTGTGNDGATINTSNVPEDVQTWSYLAFLNNSYAASLQWVTTNLMTIDNPQTINSKLTGNTRILGETYASLSLRELTPSESYDQPPDPNAVWLEGTAHTVAALLARGLPAERDPNTAADLATALLLLQNIATAQQLLGVGQTVGGASIPAGQGIVASSSVLNGGFGSSYYPNLHIGATGWAAIAAQIGNPFQLTLRI